MSKYQGFIPLPRSVETLPIWGNPYDTAVWLYCVLHASQRGYRRLKPGQFYTSQEQIAQRLGITRKTVGIALRRLERKGLICVTASGIGTLVTVMYWDEISSGRGFEYGDDQGSDCQDSYPDGDWSMQDVNQEEEWVTR